MIFLFVAGGGFEPTDFQFMRLMRYHFSIPQYIVKNGATVSLSDPHNLINGGITYRFLVFPLSFRKQQESGTSQNRMQI